MRVISGDKRGTKLFSPKNTDIRPTEDRVKENVFNLISHNLQGSTALDLFAGSGAIGIEFLSRGSERVYFVEKNKESIKLIEQNLEKTDFKSSSVLIKGDSISTLSKLKGMKFNYIYIDPPYDKGELYVKSIESIINYDLIDENSVVIIEEDENYRNTYDKYLNLLKSKKYGNTHISIWSKK
ncbi:MAG: 16S rRNA (guanine(966)-N(2))-methyltransferase RsmD [Peptoniphilus sp.]|nr:16S rRNA (guanine(966)-N(2))-methyltransferase RsmD [Peptoniphilus sp.]